ncbi:MAG: gluconolaconase [Acidobacteria bacterium]|nr:gluconolaconase [Acidobacteriota bacterium]
MSKAGKIISINPSYAIPGGEVSIRCEGFEIGDSDDYGVFFSGRKARLVGASAERILAIVPGDLETTDVDVHLENAGDRSASFRLTVGKKLADDLHIVANPAVDPADDSIILTRSGSRGQQLPVTLYRLEKDGFLQELSADVMNPTGVAFDQKGKFFVTNRAQGEVCRIERSEEIVTFSTNLGIATGIAFDSRNAMYVGDRSGTIYRVSDFGSPEAFATIEPSVSAYHLAFGFDDRLYVTAPGLSSFDAVYVIDRAGFDSRFFRGLGRPQGLAFDQRGYLYVAACFEGKRGVVRITADGEKGELFVAGSNVVGLCFTRQGEMIVATNEAVYSLPVGIYGTLLK